MSKKTSELIDILAQKYSVQYIIDQAGQPFVLIKNKGVVSVTSTESKELRAIIMMISIEEVKISSKSHVDACIDVIRSRCLTSGRAEFVFRRVGRFDDTIIIDLGGLDRKYVLIDSRGYRVSKTSPVLFTRHSAMLEMPEPEEFALDRFHATVGRMSNLVNKEMCILIVAFLVKALMRDRGSFPILILEGKQGAGKSLFSRRLLSLIDHAHPVLLPIPNDEERIRVQISSRYILGYDNLSGISNHMSDVLCRISTGGGFSCRTLYTTNDEFSVPAHSPIILNGIDEPTIRQDLVDRSVLIELEGLNPVSRVSEITLDEDFKKHYPKLLGGLYGLTSMCIKLLPKIQTTGLPRMTEYARVGIAVEKALDLPSGTFLSVYNKNLLLRAESAFWEDAVCSWIYEELDRRYSCADDYKSTAIVETASSLLHKLNSRRSEVKVHFRSLRALTSHLRRFEPLLNQKGIQIEFKRSGDRREIHIDFKDRKRPSKERELSKNKYGL